mmetsp:Transcript_35842/g.107741  ORF Transcript_35842/g.107741 Transcript_35842/m.107741 type:complete len:186 (+) Transcript_35842:350-907(+)
MALSRHQYPMPASLPATRITIVALSGRCSYVGGQAVAMDRKRLQELGINRVVMCQDRDGRCYFEGEAWVEYHRFPIGKWRSAVGSNPTPPQVVKYFEPHVKYVEAELAKGNNCLIHCLAGAHRAGTATIASLMWMLKIPDNEAIPLAQRMRPVINPIGGYPLLLSRLSAGLQSLWAKAEVPKTES